MKGHEGVPPKKGYTRRDIAFVAAGSLILVASVAILAVTTNEVIVKPYRESARKSADTDR